MNSVTKPNLVVAAAVAAVLGATNAHALNAAQTAAAVTAGQVYYSGGSSAAINAIYFASQKFLVTSTIDVFTDGSGTTKHPASIKYLVVSGTTNSSSPAGIAAGTNIVEIYRYTGGSFPNGGAPQALQTTLPYPCAADLAAATGQPGYVAGSQPTSINPSFTYSSTFGCSAIPDYGFTDEEPPLFNVFANLNGLNNNVPVSLSNLSATPAYDSPFAVAVTANAFNAGKTNFTRAEIAGILKHTISDWSQLFSDTGAQMPQHPMNIIDRGSGSGTKAAGTQYFLGYPGNQGGLTPASVSGTNIGNYTGTVLATPCTTTTALQDIKEPSSFAIADDLLAANQNGCWAVGILGIEFPPALEQQNSGTNDYFFAKINGVAIDTGSTANSDNINNPVASGAKTKYTNVINGSYDFWYEGSFNTAVSPALSGARLGLVNAIKTTILSASISGANAGVQFPNAVEGILLDPNIFKTPACGVLSVTRKATSPGPLQIIADASTSPAIQFCADPF